MSISRLYAFHTLRVDAVDQWGIVVERVTAHRLARVIDVSHPVEVTTHEWNNGYGTVEGRQIVLEDETFSEYRDVISYAPGPTWWRSSVEPAGQVMIIADDQLERAVRRPMIGDKPVDHAAIRAVESTQRSFT